MPTLSYITAITIRPYPLAGIWAYYVLILNFFGALKTFAARDNTTHANFNYPVNGVGTVLFKPFFDYGSDSAQIEMNNIRLFLFRNMEFTSAGENTLSNIFRNVFFVRKIS